MKDAQTLVNPRKKTSWVTKLFLFLGLFLCVGILASCTKAFVSSSDQVNMIYAYVYGQDSSEEDKSNYDTIVKSLAGQGMYMPNGEYEKYLSTDFIFDSVLTGNNDGTWTVAAYPEPQKVTYKSGDPYPTLSKPQEWIDKKLFTAAQDQEALGKLFGKSIVATIMPGSVIKAPDQPQALDTYIDSFQSVKAISLFGGFNKDDKVEPWLNYNKWFEEAYTDSHIGPENVPSFGFNDGFRKLVDKQATSNRAGLNTSGKGGMFGQPGEKIYIENKTWAQAFYDYGPLEGLLVWPLGWLINTFDVTFGPLGSGWAELLTIFLFTVIVRSLMLVTSFFTQRSQAKMNELQPQVASLKAKYPNAATGNREEKLALSKDTNALYKKNGIHPFLQILPLIIQFPIFLCVWGALQGSAELSSGSLFGIEITSSMMDAMRGINTSGMGAQVLAVLMFIVMSVAQIMIAATPLLFQSWKTKRFVVNKVKVGPDKMQNMPKYMAIGMSAFTIFIGITLPAGMSLYWYFGALMSLLQTFITELVGRHNRHKKMKDGDALSAMRRSKHHDSAIKSVRKSR